MSSPTPPSTVIRIRPVVLISILQLNFGVLNGELTPFLIICFYYIPILSKSQEDGVQFTVYCTLELILCYIKAMEKTRDKIIKYIKSEGQATPANLSNHLKINRQATHRQISKLLEDGIIYKIGRPPKVFYLIKETEKEAPSNTVSDELKKIIDENYLIITPSGERKEGFAGFKYWCERHNLPVEKTALEYAETLKKYGPYKKDGLIDGGYKMNHTFGEVYLDHVFYLDFYSIERFGKTKLGQLLL